MNYAAISKSTMTSLYEAYASLKNSPLSPSLRVLLELHISHLSF